jgi:hypothetical protein
MIAAKDVLTRLRAVAFTDSVHSVPDDASKPVREFMLKHCVNYVKSDEPLDTPIERDAYDNDGCPCVSAGTYRLLAMCVSVAGVIDGTTSLCVLLRPSQARVHKWHCLPQRLQVPCQAPE